MWSLCVSGLSETLKSKDAHRDVHTMTCSFFSLHHTNTQNLNSFPSGKHTHTLISQHHSHFDTLHLSSGIQMVQMERGMDTVWHANTYTQPSHFVFDVGSPSLQLVLRSLNLWLVGCRFRSVLTSSCVDVNASHFSGVREAARSKRVSTAE